MPIKSKLSRFFSFPRVDSQKPPLEPKWAITISLITLISGPLLVAIANLYFDIPLLTALLCFLAVAYALLGLAWSFLDWKTRNAAIRGHNAFIIFAACLIMTLIIIQDDYESFPTWAIVLLIIAGIAGYSVGAVCGIRNFVRWRRGEFDKSQTA
jgi:peptidoglycan/LPS O-acetylase OafA/YrhL